MSFDDTGDNPREELYRRFLKSLKEPVGDRFFDEDELVEIFDYAGDIGDDYARSEALFCGARLYPDSTLLSERRALLYLDLEDADKELRDGRAAAYVNDNPTTSSLLFDIVRLQAENPPQPEVALEFLMETYDRFSDEEIIRFVQLAFDLDCYQWVITHMNELKSKVSYLPSLLYEVMQEADDKSDDESAISLAEELIELEPFGIAYWATLFRAQARAGKEEDARQTFDTARALSADNKAGLLNLADTVYSYAPYLAKEAADMLATLRNENPDEFAFTDCRCAILAQNGMGDTAMRELASYVDAHPGEFRAYRQLLMCNISDARERTERFFSAAEKAPTADEMDELVNSLHLRSSIRTLNGVCEALLERGELSPLQLSAWIETLFGLEKYEKVVEVFSALDDTAQLLQQPIKGPATAYEYTVSLMKLGRGEDAEAFIASIRPFFEAVMADSPLPVRMGVRCFFTLADKIRRHPASEKLYWEYFDMLSFSKF